MLNIVSIDKDLNIFFILLTFCSCSFVIIRISINLRNYFWEVQLTIKFSGNNNNFNLVFIRLTNIFDTYLKIIKNKYNKNGKW